jgi:hypothetical protein
MSTEKLRAMANEMSAAAPSMEATRTATIIATHSVNEFVKQEGFTSVVNSVAESTTGFFVTFLNTNKPKNEQATNVWFTLNASKDLAEGLLIEKGFFDNYQVVEMEYSDGEKRTKLALKGNGRYNDINDIL